MLFALSTGHAIGLAVTGAAFIAFSLISFFVLAGRNPNFPGSRGLRWYLPLCGVFFLAMMAAVLYFGREPKGEASATPENTGATTASSTPASTPATGTAPAGSGGGNAAAGAAVFKTAGCVSCHTLKAAGATGTVGPNLDEKKPPEALVVDRVTHGKGVMPSFKSSLSEQQIHDVAAYVYQSTHS